MPCHEPLTHLSPTFLLIAKNNRSATNLCMKKNNSHSKNNNADVERPEPKDEEKLEAEIDEAEDAEDIDPKPRFSDDGDDPAAAYWDNDKDWGDDEDEESDAVADDAIDIQF